MGKVARQPLLPRGSPPLQSGGQNQRWPTKGQGGYITPTAYGVPSASEQGTKSEVAHKWAHWGYITIAAYGVPSASDRGTKSEVAHKWARWLLNHCRLWGPLRFRPRDKIRSGPQVGKVAT